MFTKRALRFMLALNTRKSCKLILKSASYYITSAAVFFKLTNHNGHSESTRLDFNRSD